MVGKKNILSNLFNKIKENYFILITIPMLLFVILLIVFPPFMRNQFIIYIFWSNGSYGLTHLFMVPILFLSLLFLIYSYTYLNEYIHQKIYSLIPYIDDNDLKISLNFISKKSIGFSISLIFIIIGGEYFLGIFGGKYIINLYLPYFIYFITMYSFIIFLMGINIWILFIAIIITLNVLKLPFKISLIDFNNWIRKDRLGGIKYLSDITLEAIKLCIIGIFLFSPAPLLYDQPLYSIYGMLSIFTVSIILIIIQLLIHNKIILQKNRLHDIDMESTIDKIHLSYLIEQIPEYTFNINVIVGLILSNIAWPFLSYYLIILFEHIRF